MGLYRSRGAPVFRRRYATLVFLAMACSLGAAPDLFRRDLFVSGQGGYHTYRIPALLSARDGSLLAFCEGRKRGASDTGDVDLLLKRSKDGGQTWSQSQVLWDDGPNTCGNPCPVLDQATGAIWLLMTHNPGQMTERQINLRSGPGARTVWFSRSADNGQTWTTPREITSSVKLASWTWYATGPGTGIQLQHGAHRGRLVVPCDHSCQRTQDAPPAGPLLGGSHIIYSDDHGQTWQLGGSVEPGMNECQVVELADGKGSLLLNMRSGGKANHRWKSLSHDGGGTWTAPEACVSLVEPRCQASLLRYNWPKGNEPGRILFCNPAGLARTNLTLRVSFDDGTTWPTARTLVPSPSAYSCLAVLPDGMLGCIYECGATTAYEKLTFVRFPLSWAEGKD